MVVLRSLVVVAACAMASAAMAQGELVDEWQLSWALPAGYCALAAGDPEGEARLDAVFGPGDRHGGGRPPRSAAPCGDAGTPDALRSGAARLLVLSVREPASRDRNAYLQDRMGEFQPNPLNAFGMLWSLQGRDENAAYVAVSPAPSPLFRRPVPPPDPYMCTSIAMTAVQGSAVWTSVWRRCRPGDTVDEAGQAMLRGLAASIVRDNP